MNKQEYRLYLAMLKARGDQARKAMADASRSTQGTQTSPLGRYQDATELESAKRVCGLFIG